MSIFYENLMKFYNDPEDQSDYNTDISEANHYNSEDENDHEHHDDDDKNNKRRHPIPLNVLHKQRQEERKEKEERDKQRKKFSGAISGNNALRPCYEFSSIFYDTKIQIWR